MCVKDNLRLYTHIMSVASDKLSSPPHCALSPRYLSARYALKYPEHVQHLVLVCPAGVVRI